MISVTSPELGRLIRLYEEGPEIVTEETVQGMEAAILVAEGEVVTRTPVNRARLRGGIHSRVERTGADVRGYVEVANVPYAAPVEYGRAPGTMPPVDAIQRWVHDKGIGGQVRTVSRGPRAGQERLQRAPANVERGIAWAIAMAIKKRGIKGHFMFRDGAKAAEPQVRRIFEAALARVVVRMRSGGG